MPLIVTALMGFLVLSNIVVAPTYAETTAPTAAPTTTASPAVKTAGAGARINPSSDGTTITVSLTSYNAVAAQTDANPLVTASGAVSNPEVVAARSSDLAGTLPYGTVIAIERVARDSASCHFNTVSQLIGYRVIADGMNERMHNKVDILLDQNDTVTVDGRKMNPAIALGQCSGVSIRVIGRIDTKSIPATQADLAKIAVALDESKHIAMK